MGLEHGAFCLGCCWVLMGLLFYGGVMSPLWIAGLALYVLVEKLAPAGHWIGRFSGAALIAWGAVIVVRAGLSRAQARPLCSPCSSGSASGGAPPIGTAAGRDSNSPAALSSSRPGRSAIAARPK